MPKARTTMLGVRIPCSIRYERTANARDKDNRRAVAIYESCGFKADYTDYESADKTAGMSCDQAVLFVFFDFLMS